jgi:hypothetical protein
MVTLLTVTWAPCPGLKKEFIHGLSEYVVRIEIPSEKRQEGRVGNPIDFQQMHQGNSVGKRKSFQQMVLAYVDIDMKKTVTLSSLCTTNKK